MSGRHEMQEQGQAPGAWSAVIAVTVADAIRDRLIRYTPVDDAHEAVALAYTRRQAQALDRFLAEAGLPGMPHDITGKLSRALREAQDAGHDVPELEL